MSIPKATTKLESHAIITGIAGGFAVGHAVATFGGQGIGVGVGLAAVAVFILFFSFFAKYGEGLDLPALVNLRGAGGALRGSAGEMNATGNDYSKLTGDDLFADTKKVLDWNFGDPRDKSDPMAQYRNADGKYQAQQGALKSVIANSEGLLGGIKDRIGVIKDLANQANSTTNMKDAQDMTNAILIQILHTLTDLLAIAAQANQANALFNYSGATDQTMADRQKVLNGIGKTVKESQLALELKSGATGPVKLQTHF